MDSPIPKPCCSGYGLALRRDESQRRVYEQVQGLGLPHPSQFTAGFRRRVGVG